MNNADFYHASIKLKLKASHSPNHISSICSHTFLTHLLVHLGGICSLRHHAVLSQLTGCFYSNCLQQAKKQSPGRPKASHSVPFSIWEVCLYRAHRLCNVFVCFLPLPPSLSVSLTMVTFFGGLSVFQRLAPRGGWTPASFKLQWDCN